MMENRSFDHALGFLRSDTYPIEGLKGDEANPTSFAAGAPSIKVSKDAQYRGLLTVDPSHALPHVNVQLYGSAAGPDPQNPQRNQGFVVDYASLPGSTPASAGNVMKCFAPENLPVLTTLAREFAVCDHWFSSLPAQTWPNRFFVHCATSDGLVDNNQLIDRRTIYHNLNERNISWFLYYGDAPQAWMIASMAGLGNSGPSGSFFSPVEYFADAAARGVLPEYCFIEPRYLVVPNDQHPDHDVHRGENLIADVYEALRNSPVWNETLLIVVYDEHGGLFDHVPPPETNVVPPDGKIYQGPGGTFRFDRLGPRVPAILISPYIKRGTISKTTYDHTSILATAKKAFGLPRFLTERDAHAATFEDVLALDKPRKDTPAQLPRQPGVREASNEPIWPEKLNDFQADMLRGLERISRDKTAHPSVRATAARLVARKDPF